MQIVTTSPVLLPGMVLLLSFTFKLVIGQKPNRFDFLEAILYLPTDIMVLALSFLVAYALRVGLFPLTAFILLVTYFLFLALARCFCKLAIDRNDHKSYYATVAWAFLAYLISVPSAVASAAVLIGGAII
jgi:hypothetical protein